MWNWEITLAIHEKDNAKTMIGWLRFFKGITVIPTQTDKHRL